jgi:serine/threonine protein kinase/Flp pilus assembly protein TadD
MDATGSDQERDPLCGTEVADGRYFVEKILGKGGMGTVYAALQRPINRKVALKLIHRELVGNADIVGRFLQEMRLTATIEHPHTVRLYDFGDIKGQPFLTTEFLQGRTLREEIDRTGAFPQARLCNVAVQIAKALRAAHEHGVVHRDLKPDNIMLLDSYGERDYVKVLDFGIARSLTTQATGPHTQTGMLLGTPAYMSPEQCEGRAVDQRSDLYSFGIVLFELASGKQPFPQSQTLPQLLMDHVAHTPPDIRTHAPGLTEELAALIMALLEKSPEDRPPSAEVVLTVLAPLALATTSREIRVPTPVGEAPSVQPAGSTQAFVGKPVQKPTMEATPDPVQTPMPVEPTRTHRRQHTLLIVFGVLVVFGAVGGLVLKNRYSVSPKAVAAALTLPGEPPFPVACVSATGRAQILAAVNGKASWSKVPAASIERRMVEARVAALSGTSSRTTLEPLVAACPSSAVARTWLGKALARLDEDEGAIEHLKEAILIAPSYIPARFNLAVELVKIGKGEEALPIITDILTDDPRHEGARLLRGQLRISSGDMLGAIDDLQAYTSNQPNAGAVWALLGEALSRAGNRPAAQAAFCRAVQLGIDRVRARCP